MMGTLKKTDWLLSLPPVSLYENNHCLPDHDSELLEGLLAILGDFGFKTQQISKDFKGTKWIITLERRIEGFKKSFTETFEYSQGSAIKESPNPVSVLWCLSLDYDAGQYSPFEFMKEFGYTDAKEAEKVWTSLKQNKQKLNSLWPTFDQTLPALQELYQDY